MQRETAAVIAGGGPIEPDCDERTVMDPRGPSSGRALEANRKVFNLLLRFNGP
jgi:hypothetical protein